MSSGDNNTNLEHQDKKLLNNEKQKLTRDNCLDILRGDNYNTLFDSLKTMLSLKMVDDMKNELNLKFTIDNDEMRHIIVAIANSTKQDNKDNQFDYHTFHKELSNFSNTMKKDLTQELNELKSEIGENSNLLKNEMNKNSNLLKSELKKEINENATLLEKVQYAMDLQHRGILGKLFG